MTTNNSFFNFGNLPDAENPFSSSSSSSFTSAFSSSSSETDKKETNDKSETDKKEKKEYLLTDGKTKTILYTQDAKFYVMRSVLMKASSFFKSMFENKEKTEVIKVPIKYDTDIVYEAMKFLHAPSYMKYEIPFDYCLVIIMFAHQYDFKELYENQSLVYEKFYLEESELHAVVEQYNYVRQFKLTNCDKKFTEIIINKLGKEEDDLIDVHYGIILSLDQTKKDELLLKSMAKLKEIREIIDIELKSKTTFIDSKRSLYLKSL